MDIIDNYEKSLFYHPTDEEGEIIKTTIHKVFDDCKPMVNHNVFVNSRGYAQMRSTEDIKFHLEEFSFTIQSHRTWLMKLFRIKPISIVYYSYYIVVHMTTYKLSILDLCDKWKWSSKEWVPRGYIVKWFDTLTNINRKG